MAAPVKANTTDSGLFVRDDAMSYALIPSKGPLVGGLSSRSVRDCRLSADAKLTIRSKGDCGVTGGFVQGSDTIAPMGRPKGATINQRHANRRFVKAMNRRAER